MPIAIDKGLLEKLEKELENAKKTTDWFTAIIQMATQLERYGYLIIREYFESKKVDLKIIDKLLNRLTLYEISHYLFLMKVINKNEREVIEKIAKERNKFVHRKKGSDYLIGTKANIEYEPIFKEAIQILKEKLNVIRVSVFH